MGNYVPKGGHAKDPEVRAAKLAAAVAEGRSSGPGDPPFEEGNVVAVVHGATSDRIVGLRAQAKLEACLVDPSFPEHVKQPYVRDTLKSWCWVRSRIELYWEMCENLGPEKALSELTKTDERVKIFEGGTRRKASQSKLTSPEAMLKQWEAHALNLARELGLTPMALAKLGKDIAATQVRITQLWEEDE